VLDLDDCLIDQKAWMDDKLSLVVGDWSDFAPPSLAEPFEREARRLIHEGPWDRPLDVAVHRSGLDESLVPELIKRWRAGHPASVAVYADAQALVEALRRAGCPIALVTDNPAAGQRQKLERLPLREAFDAIVLTAELDAAKPSPLGYAAAAAQLGLQPSAMVAICDSPWRDALGALAAGFAGAVIAPRREGMYNPARARFERAHSAAARRVHWVESLRVVPRMLGLAEA
jgi:HAD superfamily hydrolase (TIGR01509 family)